MYISPVAVGLGALVLALLLTLFLPLGRARSNHLISSLVIFVLFAAAAAWLLPEIFGANAAVSLAVGAALGLLAVLYRALRRWLRYFRGVVYRTTHPYYWFGRMWRSANRSGRRRRR